MSSISGTGALQTMDQPNVEDVLSVDVENENVEENVNLVDDETVIGNGMIVPEVGMRFKCRRLHSSRLQQQMCFQIIVTPFKW